MTRCLALVLALTLHSTLVSARTLTAHPDETKCRVVAIDYAQRRSAEGLLFATTGAGALGGLGIGSIVAASGVGAAIGAVAGAFVGIAIREERYVPIYVAAYSDCMAGRPIS